MTPHGAAARIGEASYSLNHLDTNGKLALTAIVLVVLVVAFRSRSTTVAFLAMVAMVATVVLMTI